MPSLLGGYRALDLTDEKGLLCGNILGGLGVDVIKIERPGGDPARNIGPFYKDTPHPEKSLYWLFCNTNKRGLTLDITKPDGQDILKKMVAQADFIIESFEPGYMQSLGLGYSQLELINPRIIMTSITPFGQTGPYAHYKGADMIIWALGGLMYLLGYPDRPPVQISVPQSFFQGGLHASVGSMVAHYHRQLTGEGQWVDVSIQESIIMGLNGAESEWDLIGVNRKRSGSLRTSFRPDKTSISFPRIWPCKDGHIWFNLGTAGGVTNWILASTNALINEMKAEGMARNLAEYNWATFNSSTISQEKIDHISEVMGAYFRNKTKAELYEKAIRYNITIAPMQNIADLLMDPQLKARKFFVQVEHPEIGETITYPGAPFKIGEAPWQIRRRAPLIGEHNDEVYRSELGFSTEELCVLKQSGII